MNQWKSAHAIETPLRTLAEAMAGADIFFGLSAKGALTADMVKAMAPDPIIFAMANPDPEITPEDAQKARDDVIIATGPLRLSQPGQQRPWISLYLPRRARRARQDDQHGDEDRGRARARRSRARGRSRRGGERLSRREAALWPRLHHSGPVRSAPHSCRADRGRQSGDGFWSGAAADRRPHRLQGAIVRPPRPDRRRDAADHRARPSNPEARRLRRGRGGAGHPRRLFVRQPGSRSRHSGRPRRAGADAQPRRRVSISPTRASRFTTPACRTATRSMPNSSTSGCRGRDICCATASA